MTDSHLWPNERNRIIKEPSCTFVNQKRGSICYTQPLMTDSHLWCNERNGIIEEPSYACVNQKRGSICYTQPLMTDSHLWRNERNGIIKEPSCPCVNQKNGNAMGIEIFCYWFWHLWSSENCWTSERLAYSSMWGGGGGGYSGFQVTGMIELGAKINTPKTKNFNTMSNKRVLCYWTADPLRGLGYKVMHCYYKVSSFEFFRRIFM